MHVVWCGGPRGFFRSTDKAETDKAEIPSTLFFPFSHTTFRSASTEQEASGRPCTTTGQTAEGRTRMAGGGGSSSSSSSSSSVGAGRRIVEVMEESLILCKGFVECVGALAWCLVLLVSDFIGFLFPKRKSFRGDTVLITGTHSVIMTYLGGMDGSIDRPTLVWLGSFMPV